MTTETVPGLIDRTEQTPAQIADQAWVALAQQITPRTTLAVIKAELAYVRSLRSEDEPVGTEEDLLVKASNFRHKIGKIAALKFFDGRLRGAVQVRNFIEQGSLSDIANMRLIQTCGSVIAFINNQIPPRRRRY